MKFAAALGKKTVVLALVLVLALSPCTAAYAAQIVNAGYISTFRTLDGEPAAGVTTRYKLSIRKAGTVTAVLTDKTDGTSVTLLKKSYPSAGNILLQVPAQYNKDGHEYTLAVKLTGGGKVTGQAKHVYSIVTPVARVDSLSASASFDPGVGEQLGASFSLPYPANVTAVVKKGGATVVTLAENKPCGVGKTSLTWNGCDAMGQLCESGTYTIEVSCANAVGASPVVSASFQITGDPAKVISGRVAGTITSIALPAQPVDGEKPVFYVNASAAGRYTIKLKNMDTGVSVKVTGDLKKGLNTIKINSAMTGGNEYRLQMVEQVSGATAGKAEISYTVHIDPPSVSVSTVASLEAGYGAAMPIHYSTGTFGGVIVRIMDESLTTTYYSVTLAKQSAGNGTVYWNGKDAGGKLLENGTYCVQVESVNAAGSAYAAAAFAYTGALSDTGSAQAQGSISLFAPADSPTPPENDPVRMRLQLKAPGKLKITLRSITGSKQYTVYSASVSAGVKVVTLPGDRFDMGTYVLTATVVDTAGKTTGKAVAYVRPQPVPAKIDSMTVSAFREYDWDWACETRFTTASHGYVDVYVTDGNERVRTLKEQSYFEKGVQTTLWDGRNDGGEYVPSGTYTIHASYTDRYGNRSGELVGEVSFTQPEDFRGHAIVGRGTYKNPIHIYDRPGGNSINVTYGTSAVFKVLEDRGEWLYVEVSGMLNGPVRGFVEADQVQKIEITSDWRIEVNISETDAEESQMMYVYRGDELLDSFKISSGRVKGTTPTGTFCIITRRPYVYSLGGRAILYNVMYLVGGVCIHRVPYVDGSYITTEPFLGTAASDGCVRVPIDKSVWLYENVPDTTLVYIYRK